jgi:hypothetical protein
MVVLMLLDSNGLAILLEFGVFYGVKINFLSLMINRNF